MYSPSRAMPSILLHRQPLLPQRRTLQTPSLSPEGATPPELFRKDRPIFLSFSPGRGFSPFPASFWFRADELERLVSIARGVSLLLNSSLPLRFTGSSFSCKCGGFSFVILLFFLLWGRSVRSGSDPQLSFLSTFSTFLGFSGTVVRAVGFQSFWVNVAPDCRTGLFPCPFRFPENPAMSEFLSLDKTNFRSFLLILLYDCFAPADLSLPSFLRGFLFPSPLRRRPNYFWQPPYRPLCFFFYNDFPYVPPLDFLLPPLPTCRFTLRNSLPPL